MNFSRLTRFAGRSAKRGIAAMAVAGLASAGLAAVAATQASAQTGCTVGYDVSSDWGTGFSFAVTVTNNGPAITSWTLGYSYSGNQTLAQGWSGTWTQSGENITVTNASWNGSLAAGGSTQIGANFTYSGHQHRAHHVHAERRHLHRQRGRDPDPDTHADGNADINADPEPHGHADPDAHPSHPGPAASGLSAAGQPGLVLRGPGHQRGLRCLAVRGTDVEHRGHRGQHVGQQRPDDHLRQLDRRSARATGTCRSRSRSRRTPSGTGAATFTVSAPGCASVTVTGTETAAGSTTTPAHVANPFTGSTWYVNPDYTAEVATSAGGRGRHPGRADDRGRAAARPRSGWTTSAPSTAAPTTAAG